MKKIFLLFLLSLSLVLSREITVEGKLLGSNEKPMELAYVKIYGNIGSGPLVLHKVQEDGSFSFKIEDNKIHWIEFSGVDHFPVQDYFIPSVYNDEIEYEVLLNQFFPAKHLEEIYLVVKNGEEKDFESVTLTKNSNGIYTAEYDNPYDTLRYELYGHLGQQRATNGNFADAYEYDGFGDYNSLLIDKKGKLILTFDPSNYKINWDRPKISIKTEQNENAKIIEKAEKILSDKYKMNIEEMSFEEINNVTKKNLEELEKIYRASTDKLIKRMIGSYYLYEAIDKNTLGLNPSTNIKLYKEAVDNIDYNSGLWNMQNLRYISAIALKNAGYDILNSEKINKIYDLYKGSELAEYILINQLDEASQRGEKEKLSYYYNEYLKYYKDSDYAERIISEYDPNINIKIGNKAPDFTIKNLEGKEISLSDLEGKFVLIDFWATWCGPCMKEMPNLHSAYSKFAGKKFEVLSLSFDKKPSDIEKLRTSSRFKMPWKHAFVEKGFQSEIAKLYEVKGIPKPILIDPFGKIVALGGALRGYYLEQTLSQFLGAK